MLLQNGMLVFVAFAIVVVVVNAGTMTYSINDPILKPSSIVNGGTFDHCNSLECRHGRCDPMQQACICDLGWTGKLCDITIVDHTGTFPLNVFSTRQPIKDSVALLTLLEKLKRNENQKKNVEPVVRQRPRERLFVEITDGLGGAAIYRHSANSATAINKPSENTFIDNSKYIKFDSKPKGTTWLNLGFIGSPQLNADDVPKLVTVDTDDADSVCSSSYQQRPDDDRKCQFGFRCMYGTCSSDSSSKQITFQCKCDPGAMGIFCEQKCCLNCGQNGNCDVRPNGTPFCFCRRGFTGEKCEIEYPLY
ncbi:hypothetical protein DPMN_082518 [Dreissena polymorpha]|uniref:EGF-like domain-containing protein n=1 Tax=Dreissena polymorpha TaxID=45954 RepID=A0A9D3Y8A1_DREPO|nr:hypothetical protein DPMN_082518 [Dreissena polymorpha]